MAISPGDKVRASAAAIGFGSVGAILEAAAPSTDRFFITCGHVLPLAAGSAVFDAGGTRIGILVGTKNPPTDSVDLALVRVDSGQTVNPGLAAAGAPTAWQSVVTPPAINDVLVGIGADSGAVNTTVSSPGDNADIPSGGGILHFTNQVLLPAGGLQDGDSGTCLMDANRTLVGMFIGVRQGDLACVITRIAPLLDAVETIAGAPLSPVLDSNAIPGTPAPAVTGLDLSSINAAQRPMAQQIAAAFAGAGFTFSHQAAAIANAQAESSLDPNEVNSTPQEHSVGLFQLNMNGGLGATHSENDLKDPAQNIAIVLAKAKTVTGFTSATTVSDAVAAFVHSIEIPKDIPGAIAARTPLAMALLV